MCFDFLLMVYIHLRRSEYNVGLQSVNVSKPSIELHGTTPVASGGVNINANLIRRNGEESML